MCSLHKNALFIQRSAKEARKLFLLLMVISPLMIRHSESQDQDLTQKRGLYFHSDLR